MLLSAFRQPQVFQNAAARAPANVNKADDIGPGPCFAVASRLLRARLCCFYAVGFDLKRWMIGNPSPCLICCCHELSRPLGPSGTGGDKNKPGDAAVVVISAKSSFISILRCSLHVSVANSQKTRWMFQPSARLNLCLVCIFVEVSVQYFTFESVSLHLALHPDFNSPVLFNFSLLSLLFYPVQSHRSVPVISPLYHHMIP